MKIVDQVINEILLKSPYGAKAYEDRHRQKIQRQNDSIEIIEDKIIDHPHQTYINFREDNE